MEKNYFMKAAIVLVASFGSFALSAQTPSQVGSWSDPIIFDLVPHAVSNLPDGRLVTWSSKYKDNFGGGDGFTHTQIFDPTIGPDGAVLTKTISQTNHDMFCPGVNNLDDGRILVGGGSSSEKTSIYDPTTEIWSAVDNMNVPRGYQSNVTLSNGAVFTLGGSWSGAIGGKYGEIWTPTDGWTPLPSIQGELLLDGNDDVIDEPLPSQRYYRSDNHPWLWAAPNGKIFHAGPGTDMHWIDVRDIDNTSVTNVGTRAGDTYSMKGTTAMYDIGKLLKVGGSRSYSSGTPASDKTYLIDINSENPVTTPVSGFKRARTMHNSTVLPNGKVLITGGLATANVFVDEGARYVGEIYDPLTNSWADTAPMQVPRTYHSVAILMPDARVFIGGGGLCGDCDGKDVNHLDAEIYSPPYLFNANGTLATRPVINAPETADYNTSISVTGSANVKSFSLIRLSSATHSTNNEQRRIPVSFVPEQGGYSVLIPNRELLPPGYYMLFGLDKYDVPSMAEHIRIGNTIPLIGGGDESLILDLKFDEGSGIDVVDNSMYGNNAVIVERDNNKNPIPVTQEYWSSEGVFGSAMEMDGKEFESNSIVEVPYSASMATISEAFTVMAWVYRDEIEKNVAVLAHDYPKLFFGFHNSLFKLEFATSAGGVNCYVGYSPEKKWVHIAGTFDGKVARVFANGVEICTDDAEGTIALQTTGEYISSFTTSGFYDRAQNISLSGITDELDGKIDELKVYNKALNSDEIKTFYQAGANQPNLNVVKCAPNTIKAEYKLGIDGEWTQADVIYADPGDIIYIRGIVPSGEEYFVTLPYGEQNTFSSVTDFPNFEDITAYKVDTFNGGDGIVGTENLGQYAFTTISGCTAVITIDFTKTCNLVQEYRINDVWLFGEEEITVNEGDDLAFSILPNGIATSITFPDGSVRDDNASIPSVLPSDAGIYLLTSIEGECSVELKVNVIVNSDCPAAGTTCDDGDPNTENDVEDGNCNCAGTPMGVDFNINGTGVNLDAYAADTQDSGTAEIENEGNTLHLTGNAWKKAPFNYIITANTVMSFDFRATKLGEIHGIGFDNDNSYDADLAERFFALGGTETYGNQDFRTYTGSDWVTFSIPVGQYFTGDFNFIVFAADKDTDQVNQESFFRNVQFTGVDTPCAIVQEYRINGVWQSGSKEITVDEGDDLAFSILPNGISTSITFPDGSVRDDNASIPSVLASDAGIYLLTSIEGECSIELKVNVNSDCPEIGTTCDDGDPNTENDVEDGNCNCAGTPIVVDPIAFIINGIGELVDSYAPGQQDNGTYKIEDNGTTMKMMGNAWKKVPFNYTITPNTVIRFEFRATEMGEIHGIGFDNDNWLDKNFGRLFFEIAGTQTYGNQDFRTYSGSDWVTFSIPVGQYFTGDFNYLVFGADKDVDPSVQESFFRNIVFVEESAPCTIVQEYRINGVWQSGSEEITVNEGDDVELSILPNGKDVTVTLPDGSTGGDDYELHNITLAQAGVYTLSSADGCSVALNLIVMPVVVSDRLLINGIGELVDSYDPENQDKGTYEVQDNGNTLKMIGNSWKKAPLNHTITPNTVLRFEFRATRMGEIHGIGFDNDNIIDRGWAARFFALAGTQTYGNQDFRTYSGSDWVTFSIPVGQYFTGDFNYLVFGADKDVNPSVTQESYFRNIVFVEESTPCTIVQEYRINGVWQSGSEEITVNEGDDIELSILPNGIGVTITLPDGSTRGDDYEMDGITIAQAGTYMLTSDQGCSKNLVVNVLPESGPCSSGGTTISTSMVTRIEAEDFCEKHGNVRTEISEDTGGGLNLGFIRVGDWLDYRIDVPENGTYSIDYRVASNWNDGGKISLQVNGSTLGTVNVPGTGAWQTYTTVNNTITLSAGVQNIRVFATQWGWNLNWFEFTFQEPSTSSKASPQYFENGVWSGPDSDDILINPNPSTGVFDLYLGNLIDVKVNVTIFNTIGTEVFTTSFNRDHQTAENIDMSSLANGVYRIVVQAGNDVYYKSAVINK